MIMFNDDDVYFHESVVCRFMARIFSIVRKTPLCYCSRQAAMNLRVA
jgi:hypothetical protein